jgi:hypothetical protein
MLPTPWLLVHPTFFGWITLLVAYLLCGLFISWDIRTLWRGADKKPSTSKFQLVLWNAMILYVYTTIAAAYLLHGRTIQSGTDCTLPKNVWIMLGLSGITAVAAKAITVGNINAGRLTKAEAGPGGLATSDAGEPELTKVQLLTWTFVAVSMYLWQFSNTLVHLQLTDSPSCQVPDIDITLMILMGLSQGTYLGKKLVSVDTARIVSITPLSGIPGAMVTLAGAGFGETQQGSLISVDNQPVSVAATWTDTQITFAMPRTINGMPLSPGPHTIALLVGGTASAGTITFVLAPNLVTLTPPIQPIVTINNAIITLDGDGFGAARGGVLIDGTTISGADITAWNDQQVQIVLRANHPSGRAWRPGKATIVVSVSGANSNGRELTLQ